MPPLQVPDEEAHWFRAWAMTEGQLTADRDGMLTLPAAFGRIDDLYTRLEATVGYLPVTLDGQPGFSGYGDLFNAPAPPGAVGYVVSRVANYSPVGYLPQAAGIGIGRLFGASPLTSFYLARLANLLVAVTLLFFAIRLAPFGKQLYAFIALLPMTMFELASLSCDALAPFGRHLLHGPRPVGQQARDAAGGGCRADRGGSGRAAYGQARLLGTRSSGAARAAPPGGRRRTLLGLRRRQRRRRRRHGPAHLRAVVDDRFEARARPRTHGPSCQFMAHQPLGFARILWDNLQNGLLDWTLGSIGTLGWLTIALPQTFSLFILVAGLVLFMGMEEETGLQLWRRAVLAGVAVAVFLALAIRQRPAFLEPAGSLRCRFSRAATLGPSGSCWMLSAYGVRFVNRYRRKLFIIGVLVVIMAENLHVLLSRYHP